MSIENAVIGSQDDQSPVNPVNPVQQNADSAKSSVSSQPKAPAKHNQQKSNRKQRTPVLVESGQIHVGKVAGFALSEDKNRTGVVLRFPGGDSAFMHITEVGSHYPESRLNSMLVGDFVKVEVSVKPGPGKRKVRASEKLLFLDGIAEQLKDGMQDVTGECVRKSEIGAFVKITSPGPAFGFVGLLHFHKIRGGQRALGAINIGTSLVVDITHARVDRERKLLKLTLDTLGAQRREIENRFPAGISISANVFKDSGDSILLKLKSGELCLLPKSLLNGVDPRSLKQGQSTNAFVTGVDAHGVILLSKVMPE